MSEADNPTDFYWQRVNEQKCNQVQFDTPQYSYTTEKFLSLR